MMNLKKIFLTTLMTAFVFLLSAQNSDDTEYNKTTEHPENGKIMLTGFVNQEGFSKTEDFYEFYQKEYDKYNPDMGTLKEILPNLENSSIRIILGTWCIDSKQQIPRFFKILNMINYPVENIEMIAVDHNLEAADVKDVAETYNLERIPTFIIYNQEGEEIGRIEESPETTLEKDLYKIFKN